MSKNKARNSIIALLVLIIVTFSCAEHVKSKHITTEGPFQIVASSDPDPSGPQVFYNAPGLRGKYGLLDVSYEYYRHPRESEKSAWYEYEKKFFRDILGHKQYDVLVVPFQTQYSGIDRAGRMLMSYRLASEIETRTNLTVAPLNLVYPALGSNERYFKEHSVYILANMLKVSSIVWGYAGYSKKKNQKSMNAAISIIKQSGFPFSDASPSEISRYLMLPISAKKLPSMIFEDKLDETLSFLFGRKIEKRSVKRAENITIIPKLTGPVGEILKRQPDDPIFQSMIFQLLGVLTPNACEDHQAYFFVRSLVAIADMEPNHPICRLLKARAYYYLHRRPAAVAMLQDAKTPEANAFLQFLNGNLPEFKSSIEGLSPSIAALMSQIEYFQLFDKYVNRDESESKALFASQYPEWFNLLLQKLDESDLWKQHSNLDLKKFLDKNFPVKGHTEEQMERAALVGGSFGERMQEMELAFQDHIRLAFTAEKNSFTTMKNSGSIDKFDILVLVDAVGLSNLMRKARFLNQTQGLHKEAVAYCNKILEIYQGHPYFTILKVEALAHVVDKAQGIKKTNLMAEIRRLAKNTFHWAGNQNWALLSADYYLYKYSPNGSNANKWLRSRELMVGRDFPPRPNCVRHLDLYSREDLIEWSNDDINDMSAVVSNLIKKNELARADLFLKKYKGRFEGHPNKFQLLIEIAEARNELDLIKKLCREQIDKGSDHWPTYQKLAETYINEADYEHAAMIFKEFPLLKDREKAHSVLRSNRAYQAGESLFWRGAWKLAKPFLVYSANLKTGSSASLTASALVAILDNKMADAASFFLRAAKRYDTAYSYNDYISILHLHGESKSAWALFNSLVGRYTEPLIWNSAWVGHRIQNISKAQLKQWLREISDLNQISRQRSFPARFALMCLIDRKPDYDMAEFIGTIDDLSNYKISRVDKFYGPQREKIGPGKVGIPQAKSVTALRNTPQESIYGSFAKAYELIKGKKYRPAYEILYQRSRYYSYRLDSMTRCFQSYFVWASLKAGHKKEIERFLQELGVVREPTKELDPKDFDAALSSAAYCSTVGRHKEALKHFQKAFALRPWTGKRHFPTWYQMTELAAWLYEDTGFKPYRDLALQYAKTYQVLQPWFSWAYAFEAKYGTNRSDRIKALAMTQFLDAQSAIASELPQDMKDEAKQWFKKIHPLKTGSENKQI